jgi:hypothetical protein
MLASTRPDNPRKPCTHQFTAQYGIPCQHRLMDRRRAGNLKLEKVDFHPYWWLDRSLQDEDQYLQYHEFDRVRSLRGRPRGSTNFASDPKAPRLTQPTASRGPQSSRIMPSARRMPSAYEAIDLAAEDERDERARAEAEAEEMAEAENGVTFFEPEEEGELEPEPTATRLPPSAQPSKRPRGRPRGPAKTKKTTTTTSSGERPVGISKPTRAGRLPKPSQRLLSSLD